MRENKTLSDINTYRAEIMGFAALWVLLYHEWQLLSTEWSAAYYVERFIKDIGFIGVDMFLLLSGMGLSYAIEKHSVTTFYKRRFERLVIPVLAAALLRAVVSRWSIGWTLRCVSGYNFFRGDTTAFIWYVYAIASFYLIFPLYWHFFSKSRNQYIFFFAVLAAWYVIFGVVLKEIFSATSWLVINRVPVFLLGVLFGWMEKHEEKRLGRGWLTGLSLLILAAGLAAEFYCSAYGATLLMPMPTVFLPALAVGTALVLLLALVFSKIGKHLSVLRFFGGISLELYCLQELMGDWLIPLLTRFMPLPAVNAAFFILVTASAFVLHKTCEMLRKREDFQQPVSY